MNHSTLRSITVALVLSLSSSFALSVVAQSPLLNSTAAVRPNIALVFDTSGSMAWECVYAKHVTDLFISEGATWSGLTDSCLDSDDLRHASPVNNLLFYNPKIRYARGYTATGALRGNATVNNTSVVTLYMPKSGQDPTTYTTSAQLTDASKYDKYEVRTGGFRLNNGTTTATNIFGAHGGSRTDCAAATCNLAEERQNIANWRAYNFDRMAAAKTGIGGAFASQIDNFRLAYGTIYGSPNTMQDYGLAKTAFYTWLDARASGEGSGTPLRAGLNRAGIYYSSTANSGPWGANPSAPPAGETATSHLSCRRSFTLMITDGFYNDGLSGVQARPNVGNVDGQNGPLLTHATATPTQTYKYTPGSAADARSIGKSDNTNGTGGTSNTLADVALKYWVSDLRPDLPDDYGAGGPSAPPFWQNMTSYMVSFGASGRMTEAAVAQAKQGALNWTAPVANEPTTIDDMRHAAHNGGGEFLKVNNAAQFATDLGNVIGSIAGQEFSQAGVAASAVTLTTGTQKFVPYFTSGSWWGNLEMVNVATQARVWQVIATDGNGQPTGVTTFPASYADRNILVWVNAATQAVAFNPTNVNNATHNLKGSNANMQMASAVSNDVINFLRGDRSNEGTSLRKRQAILGDIVNSTPAFIKNNTYPEYNLLPSGTPGQGSFATYMASKAARTEGALFVGANDGMLHAFAEGYAANAPGRELVAFIPRSVLGKLEALSTSGYAYAHTFTVDGPITEVDAYVTTPNLTSSGSSLGWKNLIVGTTGAGAKAVYALNVSDLTSMNNKSVLWEINPDPAFPVMPGNTSTSFSELGHVLSPVQNGTTVGGDWVSVFGNGYDSASGKASLFIVETATGRLLRRIDTDATTGNGLGGVRLVLNANKQIIGAYAGDLKGRLWKFDLSSSSPASWGLGNGGVALFTAESGGVRMPITAQPAVMERTDQPSYSPSYMVTVATGKLFEAGDTAVPSVNQAAFGLWDRKPFGSSGADTISDSSLEPVTQTLQNPTASSSYVIPSYVNGVTSIDWNTRRGWKIEFNLPQRPGQRVIDPVEQILKVVKIDTVTPDASATSCKASKSNGLNLVIDPLTGICRVGGTLDTNNDGQINSSDAQDICGYTTLADGRDVILTLLDSSNLDTGLRNAQSSSGGTTFRAGDPPTETCQNSPTYAAAHPSECSPTCQNNPTYAAAHPETCGTCLTSAAYAAAHQSECCALPAYRTANPSVVCEGTTLNRSWRQLFLRTNN